MSAKRFPASVNCAHRATLTQIMARVPTGGGAVTIDALEDANLRDLAGALNYWATQPGGCDSPAYPVDIQPEIVYGDYSRKVFAASHEVVTAFPFRMPANGTTHVATAEYAGQPWLRLMTVSTVPGDMDAPMRSAGKNPDIYIAPGDFPAGTLLYANNILTDAPIPGASGSGFSIVWPAP